MFIDEQVLVTGGSGYVGVHTCSDLLANGHEVFVVDNFSNLFKSSKI